MGDARGNAYTSSRLLRAAGVLGQEVGDQAHHARVLGRGAPVARARDDLEARAGDQRRQAARIEPGAEPRNCMKTQRVLALTV